MSLVSPLKKYLIFNPFLGVVWIHVHSVNPEQEDQRNLDPKVLLCQMSLHLWFLLNGFTFRVFIIF